MWELSATELKLIAIVQKYTLDDSACFVDVLFTVSTQALKLKDDQKVLDIPKKRLATMQPTNQSVDQFLEIDEAHEGLDLEDIEEVEKEKVRIKRSNAAF